MKGGRLSALKQLDTMTQRDVHKGQLLGQSGRFTHFDLSLLLNAKVFISSGAPSTERDEQQIGHIFS